jgi:hypothetical protein
MQPPTRIGCLPRAPDHLNLAGGSIRSGPPPLKTVIDRLAAGSTAIPADSGPSPLSAVSAYGPPGTVSCAGPPSVLTVTVSAGHRLRHRRRPAVLMVVPQRLVT